MKFTQEFKKLNELLYSDLEPIERKSLSWVVYNHNLSNEMNLSISEQEQLELFSRSKKDYPYYAQGYAGHQFGNFVILGDGRAANVGDIQIKDDVYEIQLKGSGRTPYSRSGDGKATLYSMLREYLISEALCHLGIPTNRNLGVIKTNELVQRETALPGAISIRVAKSHLRIGTLQYAKAMGGDTLVKEVVDFAIERHYPETKGDYLAFYKKVVEAQASLIALWQSVGFIHGVLNTDNVLLSGESVDFGPCAFMDAYNTDTVFSSIDTNGRYRFGNQPVITSWNLARLGELLVPLLERDQEESIKVLSEVIGQFERLYYKEYYHQMTMKLGLKIENRNLIDGLLKVMENHKLDYTNTFVTITSMNVKSLLDIEDFSRWYFEYVDELSKQQIDFLSAKQAMEKVNPRLIPRNHIVEEALNKAAYESNYEEYHRLLELLSSPFDYEKNVEEKYLKAGLNNNYKTYCGT
jgi:uncharacterized protein YdiU (UPF0061 family)